MKHCISIQYWFSILKAGELAAGRSEAPRRVRRPPG
nr:MAG TPA: hypothetical protein [Caudoviricetes sp.]